VLDAQLLARAWRRDISEHAARDPKVARILRLWCIRVSVAAKEELAEELEVLNSAGDANIDAHWLFPLVCCCVRRALRVEWGVGEE
jgi:hypothetical protein